MSTILHEHHKAVLCCRCTHGDILHQTERDFIFHASFRHSFENDHCCTGRNRRGLFTKIAFAINKSKRAIRFSRNSNWPRPRNRWKPPVRQISLPCNNEPRGAHAFERYSWYHVAERHAAEPKSGRIRRNDPLFRRNAFDHAERHSGLFQDGGRKA